MPIRKPKPTSPGRRFATYPDFAEVTRSEPEKSLTEGLKKSGRDRRDIHWSCWLWVAVNNDRAEAVNDAKATVAFYAGIRQYHPMFASMGFDKEAAACADAFERGDVPGWVGAVKLAQPIVGMAARP